MISALRAAACLALSAGLLTASCSSQSPATLGTGASGPAGVTEDRSAIDAGMVRCLKAAGYDAKAAPGPQGGVIWKSSDEQEAAARTTYLACEKDLQTRGILKPARPLGEKELAALYERQISVQRCLSKEGYPPGKTPSRSAFVAGGGQWSPYEVVSAAVGATEYDRVQRACPQQR